MEEKIFVVIAYKLLVHKKKLKIDMKNCFKINSKQRIILPKKCEYDSLKNYERI